MWKGKVTPELKILFKEYMNEIDGTPPDGYDDISYDGMEYEEFVGYIKDALRRHCCIEEVIDSRGYLGRQRDGSFRF